MASGRLREWRSVRNELAREEDVVLLRKSAVLGFSLGSGARLARMRAVRADLGLLWDCWNPSFLRDSIVDSRLTPLEASCL